MPISSVGGPRGAGDVGEPGGATGAGGAAATPEATAVRGTGAAVPAAVRSAVLAYDGRRHQRNVPDRSYGGILDGRKERDGSWTVRVASFPTTIVGPRPGAKPFDVVTYGYKGGKVREMDGLEAAVRDAASDRIIKPNEASKIVAEAKRSGSEKPIDDVFSAINRADVAVDDGATRKILGSLDQRMTRAQWEKYVQKATSPSGAWGPGTEEAKSVKRADLPPGVRKVFDSWQESSPEDEVQASTFKVAGKPIYLFSQYSEFGTAFGVFDASGKDIELKEDTKNISRNTDRIQDAYDQHFRSPAMAGWKKAVQHTDIGVVRMYEDAGTAIEGRKRAALPAGVKKAISDLKKTFSESEVEVYKSKTDGTYLVIGSKRSGEGAEHFVHLSRTGTERQRFTIDL